MTNEQRVERARRLDAWLKSEETQDVLKAIRHAAVQGVMRCSFTDIDQIVWFKLFAKIAEEAEGYIRQAVNDGAVAADEIEQARSLQKLHAIRPGYARKL